MEVLLIIALIVGTAFTFKAQRNRQRKAPPPALMPSVRDDQPSAAVSVRVVSTYTDSEQLPEGRLGRETPSGESGPHDPIEVAATLQFDYHDFGGALSSRTVDVDASDRNTANGYFTGYCHFRKARRTFRLDRLSNCIDLETGEVIEAVGPYLLQRYKRSPIAARDRLLTKHEDVLRAMIYVARADGALRKPERAILYEACRKVVGDDQLSDELIDQAIKAVDTPSLTAFRQIVGRIARAGSNATNALIIDAAARMVATQREAHAAETDALDYLHKRLSAPARP